VYADTTFFASFFKKIKLLSSIQYPDPVKNKDEGWGKRSGEEEAGEFSTKMAPYQEESFQHKSLTGTQLFVLNQSFGEKRTVPIKRCDFASVPGSREPV